MGSSQKLHFAQVGQFSTGRVGQFCIGTDKQGSKSLSLRSLAAISSVLQVSPSTLLLLAQAAESGADPRVTQRHEALLLDALIADRIVTLPIPASDDLIGGVRAKRGMT